MASERSGVWRWMAALSIVALTLAACGGDDDDGASATTAAAQGETSAAPSSDGDDDARELIIARNMDVNSLDPQRAYCDTCQIYLTAVYETLIGLDPTDITKQVPRLATEWEVSEDFTTYTFTLDPAATFADGSPVEAKDVKWSWERLANLQGSAAYLASGIASIETPDTHTVVATLAAPSSAFLAVVNASYMGVVNSDVAAAEGALATADANTADQAEQWFLSNSAGSGPYQLESYTEGDALVLTRNDSYWGDAPTFPQVTLKQVDDSTAQLQQLQQGEVDIAMQISPDALGQLEGVDGVTVETIDSYNFTYVAMNYATPGGEVLADPKVREAIKLAIDYEGMLDVTVAGHGKLQASPIPNGFPGSEGLTLPSRDVDRAQQLLEEAGQAGGFSLETVYPQLSVYGVDFDTMMQKVQQDLNEIGVELELKPVDFPQFLDRVTTTGIPFTAIYFAPDHTDPSQYVQYFGLVDGGAFSAGLGGETNPEEVQLLEQAVVSSGDEKESLYNQLGQAMMDDLIIVPLVNPQLVLAYASDITGMHYSACCNLELALLGIG